MSFVEYRARPELKQPMVICAFAGWNDGGEGATIAARDLRDQWGARRFASIDPEEFYDFQVHRPTVRLVEGQTRRIDWPANDFWWARVGERDVVVFVGVEPNVRWRTYCEQILRVCSDVGASVLVTLGAFLADVPHTMPAPVSAASADPAWASRPGMMPARYEGPTGIVGVLNDLATRAGLAAVSLWAASPHYLPQTTNPKVALALMERLRDLLELDIDAGEVELTSRAWEREVDEAIQADGNLGDYVRRLEEAAEQGLMGGADASEVLSGEELAAELERYLREHGTSDE
ncbi:MAG TPA: PAC2 family protein [Actinomycetota bacterium]|nr:PAC2 family protein [Actinomycetota bacterium]